MKQRIALIAGSALAATVVGVLCLLAFLQWGDGLRHLPIIVDELLVLALMPVVVSATLSAALVSGSRRFGQRGQLSDAVRISMLTYPILFVVLLATICTWLQFRRYLPFYTRPDELLDMAVTAAGYTVLAFIVGFLPAVCAEYAVVRFIRARHAPAVSSGVML